MFERDITPTVKTDTSPPTPEPMESVKGRGGGYQLSNSRVGTPDHAFSKRQQNERVRQFANTVVQSYSDLFHRCFPFQGELFDQLGMSDPTIPEEEESTEEQQQQLPPSQHQLLFQSNAALTPVTVTNAAPALTPVPVSVFESLPHQSLAELCAHMHNFMARLQRKPPASNPGSRVGSPLGRIGSPLLEVVNHSGDPELRSPDALDCSVASIHGGSVATTTAVKKRTEQGGSKYINQYEVKKEVGRGASGKVKACYDPIHNRLVAIKVIRRQVTSGSPSRAFLRKEKAEEALRKEIAVLKKMRHKNIVQLYEVIDDPDSEKLYLVLQHIEDGPIAKLNKVTGICTPTYNPKELANYLRQVCAGLRYIHFHAIFHRDVKPENILIRKDTREAFLSDFGVSDHFNIDENGNVIKMSTSTRDSVSEGGSSPINDEGSASASPANSSLSYSQQSRRGRSRSIKQAEISGTHGTILFMPPEILEDKEAARGVETDAWSLGVTFYALLIGRRPFDCVNDILNKDPTFPPGTETQWAGLLRGLLAKKPKERLSVLQAHRIAKQMLNRYYAPHKQPGLTLSPGQKSHQIATAAAKSAKSIGEEGAEKKREESPTQLTFVPPLLGSATAYPTSGGATGGAHDDFADDYELVGNYSMIALGPEDVANAMTKLKDSLLVSCSEDDGSSISPGMMPSAWGAAKRQSDASTGSGSLVTNSNQQSFSAPDDNEGGAKKGVLSPRMHHHHHHQGSPTASGKPPVPEPPTPKTFSVSPSRQVEDRKGKKQSE